MTDQAVTDAGRKTYVFFNRRICGIDGSIQYIYNKSKHLASVGYEVLVFSVVPGKVLVESLEKDKRYIIPDMRFCPSIFRASQRRQIMNKILYLLFPYRDGTIIVESTSPVSALWGELTAKELQCRHVYYHLMEKTELQPDFRAFCRFKYERGELAGITRNTVPMMLADETSKPSQVKAYCDNVISAYTDPFSDNLDKTADLTIGSIGRLEKPYIPKLTEELIRYFEKHSDKRFNLVMIGGDGEGKPAKQIRESLAQCGNTKLIITGYLYPVPLSLVNNIDIFISASGSATATYRHGRPTIKINPLTGKTVGIFGCDFKFREKNFYEVSDTLTIENCIDRIVNGEAEICYTEKIDDRFQKEMDAEFERQLQMVLNNKSSFTYYDEKKLCQMKTPFKKYHAAYAIAGHILGGNGLRRVLKFAEKK